MRSGRFKVWYLIFYFAGGSGHADPERMDDPAVRIAADARVQTT